VELGGLLHILAGAGAAATSDAVDEAEELVLDLSSQVSHGIGLGELNLSWLASRCVGSGATCYCYCLPIDLNY